MAAINKRVRKQTADEWQYKLDPAKEWLLIETDDTDRFITKVTCLLCTRFQDSLRTMRNFSDKLVTGVTGAAIKKDNITKHRDSCQHARALQLSRQLGGDMSTPSQTGVAGLAVRDLLPIHLGAELASWAAMDWDGTARSKTHPGGSTLDWQRRVQAGGGKKRRLDTDDLGPCLMPGPSTSPKRPDASRDEGMQERRWREDLNGRTEESTTASMSPGQAADRHSDGRQSQLSPVDSREPAMVSTDQPGRQSTSDPHNKSLHEPSVCRVLHNSQVRVESDCIVQALRQLWQQEQLCDVHLVTTQGTYKAHKLVLATVSPVFQHIVLSSISDIITVHLPTIRGQCVQEVLECLYGQQLTLTQTNVDDCHQVAHTLGLVSLENVCARYKNELGKTSHQKDRQFAINRDTVKEVVVHSVSAGLQQAVADVMVTNSSDNKNSSNSNQYHLPSKNAGTWQTQSRRESISSHITARDSCEHQVCTQSRSAVNRLESVYGVENVIIKQELDDLEECETFGSSQNENTENYECQRNTVERETLVTQRTNTDSCQGTRNKGRPGNNDSQIESKCILSDGNNTIRGVQSHRKCDDIRAKGCHDNEGKHHSDSHASSLADEMLSNHSNCAESEISCHNEGNGSKGRSPSHEVTHSSPNLAGILSQASQLVTSATVTQSHGTHKARSPPKLVSQVSHPGPSIPGSDGQTSLGTTKTVCESLEITSSSPETPSQVQYRVAGHSRKAHVARKPGVQSADTGTELHLEIKAESTWNQGQTCTYDSKGADVHVRARCMIESQKSHYKVPCVESQKECSQMESLDSTKAVLVREDCQMSTAAGQSILDNSYPDIKGRAQSTNSSTRSEIAALNWDQSGTANQGPP